MELEFGYSFRSCNGLSFLKVKFQSGPNKWHQPVLANYNFVNYRMFLPP